MNIQVENLEKTFGDVEAIKGISFEVNSGAIFGLIGPNGAGKTTCMNVLATLLKPDAGTILVNGKRVEENIRDFRRKLGYMPDFFGIYRNVTAAEYLDFYGGACGVPHAHRQRRIGEVLEITNLTEKRDELVDNLSRGMKQRLCLAKALIHEPQLLILDEPASGLDPRARLDIRKIMKQVCSEGTTVIIASHILSELDDLCTHIAIMERGEIRKCAPVAEVLRSLRPKKAWEVSVNNPEDAKEALASLPFASETAVEGQTLVVQVEETTLENHQLDKDEVPTTILKTLLEAGFQVNELRETKPKLEDAFLQYTADLLA